MVEGVQSVLLGTAGLSVALVAAVALTLARPGLSEDQALRDRAAQLFLVGVAIQCLHFVEEFLWAFHVRLPELLGLTPWTAEFFVAFNVVWIAIWIASGVALRNGMRIALVPIWFFAIAAVANGIAHPVFSAVTGGYFPGLATSPFLGVLGVVLWIRLLTVTSPRTSA